MAELTQVLRPLQDHPAARSDKLLVEIGDDAALFQLNQDTALVQTVDFFTPVVDDPFAWGQIAAANALSDVYAMAGTPLTAIQLVGWPRGQLPFEILAEVIAGGADIMEQAECTIVGGHSVDNASPLFGFAITGVASPDHYLTKTGAQPGDKLLLTKPLGTGIISAAIKAGSCPEDVLTRATTQMASLNADAAQLMSEFSVRAVTDITGYGLLGHLRQMLETSADERGTESAQSVGVSLYSEQIPVLPGVAELLAEGFWPGGSQTNLEAVTPYISGKNNPEMLKICADAQTSGGLLMVVPPETSQDLLHRLSSLPIPATEIGVVTDNSSDSQPGLITLV